MTETIGVKRNPDQFERSPIAADLRACISVAEMPLMSEITSGQITEYLSQFVPRGALEIDKNKRAVLRVIDSSIRNIEGQEPEGIDLFRRIRKKPAMDVLRDNARRIVDILGKNNTVRTFRDSGQVPPDLTETVDGAKAEEIPYSNAQGKIYTTRQQLYQDGLASLHECYVLNYALRQQVEYLRNLRQRLTGAADSETKGQTVCQVPNSLDTNSSYL